MWKFSLNLILILAFGHDEEVSGIDGAKQIARIFESRGLSFDFMLDEGMIILHKG